MLLNQFQTYFIDSATQGEGLYVCIHVCKSYVCKTESRRELFSYFFRGVTFRAPIAHRSMGLVHLNWVRLGPAFQALVGFWLLYKLLILLGSAAIQSLLFIGQKTGIQESQWKQVMPLEFSITNSDTVSYTYYSLASCNAKLNMTTAGQGFQDICHKPWIHRIILSIYIKG